MKRPEQPHEKVARTQGVKSAMYFYLRALREKASAQGDLHMRKAAEIIEQRIELAERDSRDFERSLWIACADETAAVLREGGMGVSGVAREVSEIADAFIDGELDSGNKQTDNPDDATADADADDQEGEVNAEGN